MKILLLLPCLGVIVIFNDLSRPLLLRDCKLLTNWNLLGLDVYLELLLPFDWKYDWAFDRIVDLSIEPSPPPIEVRFKLSLIVPAERFTGALSSEISADASSSSL